MIINMFVVVVMYVLNIIESDCWFGIFLSLLKDKNKIFGIEFFVFLVCVISVSVDDGLKRCFDVFGKYKMSNEFLFYVYNILC